MTSIIEQADRIVGISVALAPDGVLEFASGRMKNICRRGAYIEWIVAQKEDVCSDERIEDMAEIVVRIAKPKGDGLPDETLVFCSNTSGAKGVSVQKLVNDRSQDMSDVEQCRTADYLNRCLSAPVRRLLAAFDVTDDPPYLKAGNNAIRAMSDGRMLRSGEVADAGKIVCWLVPRGER